MRRSNWGAKLSKVLITLLAVSILFCSYAIAAPVKLTILHVNDLHGRMESPAPVKDKDVLGGFARLSTLINQTRAANPNVLLLSGGDSIHGTNLVNFAQGLPVIQALNKMGFDAMALGNHEFNYGMDQLISLSKEGNFPFLSGNLKSESGVNPFSSVKEVNVGGLHIAVIGVSTPETPILTHPKNVEGFVFNDPIETVKKFLPIFRGSADLVVVLSHAGLDVDRKMAAEVKGIDVIVGGHTHTKLDAAEKVGNTYIVQAFEYGQYLGKLDLVVDNKAITSASSALVPVSSTIAEDPEMTALVADYKAKADKVLAGTVGKTSVVLDGERNNVRTSETNLGDLVADILKNASGADVGITNGGGIRASIDVGDVTMAEVVNVLPFDNTLVTLKVTGAQLKDALENGVSEYPKTEGRFPQVSGLKFTFDASKPKGQRVVSVLVNGEALDLAKTYVVATNDFMAAGGDGYESFKTAPKLAQTGAMMRDLAGSYITAAGTIAPSVEGRIVILNK